MLARGCCQFGVGRPELGSVADEDVAEAKAVIAVRERAVRLDQLAPNEREERLADRLSAGERRDRTPRELAADQSRTLKNGALARREAVEASGQNRMDRRRDRLVAAFVLQRDQLLEEEGIAVGGGRNP